MLSSSKDLYVLSLIHLHRIGNPKRKCVAPRIVILFPRKTPPSSVHSKPEGRNAEEQKNNVVCFICPFRVNIAVCGVVYGFTLLLHGFCHNLLVALVGFKN